MELDLDTYTSGAPEQDIYDSQADGDTFYDFTDEESDFENEVVINDAQQQFEQNMQVLQSAFFFVLFPILGRFIGRKTARSLWIRFVKWRWSKSGLE